MGIFENIDFDNLPEGFCEEDVREEIITPLLKELGYSVFDESNRIVRAPKLKHPFTRFGTRNEKFKQIPDYLIFAGGKKAFVIEAKRPSENIYTGANVEQAYSYAVNMEVQVKRFVLCNGKEISIFDTDKKEPMLYFKLSQDNKDDYNKLYELISPMAFINPSLFNYKSDYGMWCLQTGIKKDTIQYFYDCHVVDVFRLSDDKFGFLAVVSEMLASFDFDKNLLEDFMMAVPNNIKKDVEMALHNQPFKYTIHDDNESFSLSFSACLSDRVIKNEHEYYLPLVVKEFLRSDNFERKN